MSGRSGRRGDEQTRAHEGRLLLLVDNYHASPAAHAAFARLVASPGLRKRVRVIGLATLEYPSLPGLALDAFIAMPFTVKTLLEAVEAQHGEPDATD